MSAAIPKTNPSLNLVVALTAFGCTVVTGQLFNTSDSNTSDQQNCGEVNRLILYAGYAFNSLQFGPTENNCHFGRNGGPRFNQTIRDVTGIKGYYYGPNRGNYVLSRVSVRYVDLDGVENWTGPWGGDWDHDGVTTPEWLGWYPIGDSPSTFSYWDTTEHWFEDLNMTRFSFGTNPNGDQIQDVIGKYEPNGGDGHCHPENISSECEEVLLPPTPTPPPTSEPTSEPTSTPTSEPTSEPTSTPTSEPTSEPTSNTAIVSSPEPPIIDVPGEPTPEPTEVLLAVDDGFNYLWLLLLLIPCCSLLLAALALVWRRNQKPKARSKHTHFDATSRAARRNSKLDHLMGLDSHGPGPLGEEDAPVQGSHIAGQSKHRLDEL